MLPPEDEDGYPADITGVTRHTDQEDETSREDMNNEETLQWAIQDEGTPVHELLK